MMEKDYTSQIYEDFLKSLRIALTNTSVYFPEHPLYIKAIDDFKANIVKTVAILKPITIGITQHSLIFGGKYLADTQLTRSIADFFHIRKIKSLTLSDEVSLHDLAVFFSCANLPPREIIVHGGLSHMLERKNITRVRVSDLSYCELLAVDGVEYKDLWLYLLREGLQENNAQQLEILANNFQKVISRLKLKEIVTDGEIGSLIENFFAYLQKADSSQFSKCLQDLAKISFTAKDIESTANLDSVKKLLTHLSAEDLARVFLMQLRGHEKIDPLSFGLFSKLISNEEHIKLASSLAQQLRTDKEALGDPEVILKLRELFSLPAGNPVIATYRHHLDSFLGDLKLSKGLSFDSAVLENNYRALLLGLYSLDKEPDSLAKVLDYMLEALEDAIRKKNTAFIKNFSEALAQKMNELSDQEQMKLTIREKTSAFAENLIFEEDIPTKEWLSELISVPVHNRDYYLDKIFKEQKINKVSLGLFFKFFAGDIGIFYSYLEPYMDNVAFIKKIMASLEKVCPKLSADILKHIYSVSNNYIRLEVLKQMRVFSIYDKTFLFAVLSGGDAFQRKEALAIVAKTPSLRKEAASLLLSITNPFGIRSRIILDNLELIRDKPFDEMREYLVALSRYRFFWNTEVRKKAKEVLIMLSGDKMRGTI